MIGLSIDVRGLDDIKKKLSALPANLRDKAMQPAINKTAEKAKTEVKRAITEEYFVKSGEVQNAMELRRAGNGDLKAKISIFGSKSKRGRSANMIHFLAVMQAAGIAVKTRGAKVTRKQAKEVGRQLGFLVKRGSGVKTLPGAFVGNKGRTVFMREGKGRLPIKPLQVIGFSQMFASKKISGRVQKKIADDFGIELDRAIKMVLERNARGN